MVQQNWTHPDHSAIWSQCMFSKTIILSPRPWIGLDYVYSWGERISLRAVSNWKQLHVPSCSISMGKREVVVGACTTGIIWRACSGLHHMLNLKIHKVHLWCLSASHLWSSLQTVVATSYSLDSCKVKLLKIMTFFHYSCWPWQFALTNFLRHTKNLPPPLLVQM